MKIKGRVVRIVLGMWMLVAVGEVEVVEVVSCRAQ